MKTYAEWKGDLDDYLEIGDVVDEEIVDYFINTLPPACWTGKVIQMGEPCSHVNGRATYHTLHRVGGDKWVYVGHCFRKGNAEAIAV